MSLDTSLTLKYGGGTQRVLKNYTSGTTTNSRRELRPSIFHFISLIYVEMFIREDSSISEEEAIRAAEEFIVLNGYTDLPPADGSLKITHEYLYTDYTD